MSKITLATFVGFILLLSLNTYAQNKHEIVTLRIYQNYFLGNRFESYIRVSYANKSAKIIKLEKAGLRMKDAAEDANSLLIQHTINDIVKDGYKLLSSSISGTYQYTRTLIIFEKNE
ncbi:MAG: hypothetical protein SGJ00_05380 [bacterium]|nr:hypothetical protein [bacterium]